MPLDQNAVSRKLSRAPKFSFSDGPVITQNTNSSSKWGHLCNLRRRTKKSKFVHRDGPAPKENAKKGATRITLGALDSDVEEEEYTSKEKRNLELQRSGAAVAETSFTSSIASSKALIIYFAKLATAADTELVDFDFVESLLKGGADVNFTDRHGQTVLHEVARNWHPDVAFFLLLHGADVNQADKWGRSPLHSASAVDHGEMVQFLLQNEANVRAKTSGELQSPVHYAAKFNAVGSLKVLMDNHADVNDRDYKRRTPLFVAAEAAREDAVRYLVEQGVPVGVFDETGLSALALMIEKMPNIAKESLEQFVSIDRAFRKEYYYLNYLEHDPTTWMDLEARKQDKKKRKLAGERRIKHCPTTPMKVAVRCQELDILMHPVMQRLISVKWKLFGKWGSIIEASFHLSYVLIWTWLAIFLPRDNVFYRPLSTHFWRVIFEFLGVVMTLYFIFKQIWEVKSATKEQTSWRVWRTREIERDLAYCHPRWAEERQYIESELRQIRNMKTAYFKDAWNIMDWLMYVGVLTVIVTRIISVTSHDPVVESIHPRAYAFALIFMWLHFMKSCRAFKSLGPFITMLGHVLYDTLRFAFLFFEFFIPYVCAFWIIFGGSRNAKIMKAKGQEPVDWKNFHDLTYSVWLATLIADVNLAAIESVDRIMAQILIGSYFAIASVVCMNLYIALLSETFSRVYQNAKANAALLQAQTILQIEKALWKKRKDRMEKYIQKECGPLEVYQAGDHGGDDDSHAGAISRMARQIVNRLDCFEDFVKAAVQQQRVETPIDESQDGSIDGVISGEYSPEINRLIAQRERELQQIRSEISEIKSLLSTHLQEPKKSKTSKISIIEPKVSITPVVPAPKVPSPRARSRRARISRSMNESDLQRMMASANLQEQDLMRTIFNRKLTDIDEFPGQGMYNKKGRRRKRKGRHMGHHNDRGAYSDDLSGSWEDLSFIAGDSVA